MFSVSLVDYCTTSQLRGGTKGQTKPHVTHVISSVTLCEPLGLLPSFLQINQPLHCHCYHMLELPSRFLLLLLQLLLLLAVELFKHSGLPHAFHHVDAQGSDLQGTTTGPLSASGMPLVHSVIHGDSEMPAETMTIDP